MFLFLNTAQESKRFLWGVKITYLLGFLGDKG